MKLSRINIKEIEWHKYLSYVGVVATITWTAFDTNMQKRLIKSLSQPVVLILILFNGLFSYYIYSLTPSNVFGGVDDVTTADNLMQIAKLRLATQRAITAFIIAYLAYLDHYTAAFWVIWMLTYYMPA